MKLLAIDTATQVCGIALSEGDQLVAELRLNQKNVHNERLAPAVQGLLKDAGWQVTDLEGLVVSIGPGSFTGLRIGLAYVKGLAFTLEIPVAAVKTLDVLANGSFITGREIAVVVKARIGEYYFARYKRRDRELVALGEYEIVATEDLEERLDGAFVIAQPYDPLEESSNWQPVPQEFCLSSPAILSKLGYQKLQQGRVEDAAALEPFYLKEFVPRKKVAKKAVLKNA